MLTICITSFNTLPFLQMTVLSLRRHTGKWAKIWVWDNGSTDGSLEWAQANADVVHIGENRIHGHGTALDRMSLMVETEFIASVDSDVEFTAKPFLRVIHQLWMDRHAAAADWVCESFNPNPRLLSPGRNLIVQDKVFPACAVLKTAVLKAKIASGSSWCQHEDGTRFYDVGGTLLRDLQADGFTRIDSPEIKESIIHYGNSTWENNGYVEQDVLDKVARNRRSVIEKLKDYPRPARGTVTTPKP